MHVLCPSALSRAKLPYLCMSSSLTKDEFHKSRECVLLILALLQLTENNYAVGMCWSKWKWYVDFVYTHALKNSHDTIFIMGPPI